MPFADFSHGEECASVMQSQHDSPILIVRDRMIGRHGIAGESGRSITLREMQQNSLDGWRNFGAGSKTPVDDSQRQGDGAS